MLAIGHIGDVGGRGGKERKIGLTPADGCPSKG